MAHAEDKIRINNGKITLYHRDDVKDGLWHCRFHVKGHRGYIRRSTAETDLERAKLAAARHYTEVEVRQQNNLPVKKQYFAQVAQSFMKEVDRSTAERRKCVGRSNVIKGTLNRYLIPYWGKRDITHIQKADLIAYRQWRKDYWITGPGKDVKSVSRKKVPAPQTLKMEWTALRGVFQHGVDLGLISPLTMHLLKHERAKVNRRPAFTEEEWSKLHDFIRTWPDQTNNPRVKSDRELLRDYILIMANSGMRIGEARNLRWRDVGTFTNQSGTWPTLRVDGKTGEHEIAAQPVVTQYLNRMRQRGFRTDPDDLVFTHKDGEPINTMTGFTPLLERAGLLYDSKGKKHTLYSLRHTYATLRLENGADVYWLAKNMSTGIQMIQNHYGQSNIFKSVEANTALRKRPELKVANKAA